MFKYQNAQRAVNIQFHGIDKEKKMAHHYEGDREDYYKETPKPPKSIILEVFKEQLKNSKSITEERLQNMAKKTSEFGTEIIPGDILLFAIFIEKEDNKNNVSDIVYRAVKLTVRDLAKLEKMYRYVDVDSYSTWPKFILR